MVVSWWIAAFLPSVSSKVLSPGKSNASILWVLDKVCHNGTIPLGSVHTRIMDNVVCI